MDKSLVERTMEGIRELVRAKGLMAGDVLPSETQMALQLGVSRPVMREAMRGLATLRIIAIGNGRKARVAMPDASSLSVVLDHASYTGGVSIQQILDARRTLEVRTAGLAAMRRSENDQRQLAQIVQEMFDALEADQTAIRELDIRFHETIARASGNPLYSILVESFRVITRQTWQIGWRSRATYENRLENIRCHQRIMEAIAEQNAERAEALMDEHFAGAVAVLLRAGIV
ncbi:FadR/GntR family transcriptional regulator [Paracoccus sp. (in: a-proteobacteria)]|uniref:FadR/GntR family transcriptional regulator n=1 Tax=Paracoccus sp. TaxID=267 RepID=UPI00396CEC3D